MKEQRLTIIQECVYTSKSGNKMPGYLCKCSCGNTKVVSKYNYDNGKTRSCGCLIRDFNSKRGQFYNSSYYDDKRLSGIDKKVLEKISNSYRSMMARCTRPKNRNYKNYGGRGICVCEEWINDKVSFAVWAINNGFEIGKSIDRIDVNGNYEPSNCRWATSKEQASNTRRNVYITFNGERYTITALSKIIGVDAKILSNLSKHGIELRKDIISDERNAENIEGQMEISDFPEVMP